ncbi:MAG TPA: hypothetical protein VFR85_12270 [Anaeromyxobacteraceae bacterium]|nr:hypothetical protein [Anaeromyxobacteraceae bacterium]
MRLAIAAVAAVLAAGPSRAADAGEEAARSYRLDTAGTTQNLKIGQKGKLVLSIEPLQPRVHIHPQAPLKIRLSSSPGLKLDKAELVHRDAADPKAEGRRFEVPFAAAAAGKQEARADLDFFICSDTWCVKQVRQVIFPVDVR